MTDGHTLEQWGGDLARHAAAKLAQGISATGLVMRRPGFGQTMRPAAGSVLASPAIAFNSGEPDYFFHWIRDSSAVMEAVRILANAEKPSGEWTARFKDFIQFSLGLRNIDGPRFLARADFRTKTSPEFQQYLRADEEIAAVQGSRAAGDVRYNADGTLDFIGWNRPQHDGPAQRALVAMRFEDDGLLTGEDEKQRLAELIDYDLGYTAEYAGEPCYDIWEEESALHYCTVLVQLASLEKGAARAERTGGGAAGKAFRGKAQDLRSLLDGFWSSSLGHYRSRLLPDGAESSKALDFAVILGIIHAGLDSGPHSVQDDKVLFTLAKLEQLFGAEYAINRGRAEGIMSGRYKGDNYISGGAYYFSTFGAAEFYYRLAEAHAGRRASSIAKGDAILARVREFVPQSGDLSEQFDQKTGAPTSAKDLSWSYACFITAWHARQVALGQRGSI